jgi:hypothetical protein
MNADVVSFPKLWFFYTSAEVRIFSELVFNSGELRKNFGGVTFGIPERGTTMEDTIGVMLVESDGGAEWV